MHMNVNQACIVGSHRTSRKLSSRQFNSSYFHYVKSHPGDLIESIFFSSCRLRGEGRYSNQAFNLEKNILDTRESGRDVPETSPEVGEPFRAALCNTTSSSNRVMGSGEDELRNRSKKIDTIFPPSYENR